MRLRLAVSLQQPADECEERDTLELTAPVGVAPILRRLERGFKPMGVVKCLRGERRHDLAEADIALREGLRIALGAEEDRADHGAAPTDGNDDDRANVAKVEQRLDPGEHRIVDRVGNEHRLAGFEGPAELRVSLEIDDEVTDRRILVAGDEADVAGFAGEEDRASIESERFAQLPGDGLQDVDEVERGGDLLEDIDDRD